MNIIDEKMIIGLIKIFLLDFPDAQRTINSLSLLNLFRTNKIEIKRAIGVVS
tara:strand:+ start:80 stop:235 length:156 start_codon:yes stop_codon:yes gene_type:complete